MKRFWILFSIGIFALLLLVPRMASAWFLNSANVDLARALSSLDAVQRDARLNRAQAQLDAAKSFSDDERIVLAQARVFFARGEYERAAQTFERASASLRADPIARFLWGQAAFELHQPSLAFEHWRVGGAFVYFSQNAHRAADKHDWKTAEEFARIMIGIQPDDGAGHYVLGDAISRRDANDAEALRAIDRARELTTDPEILSTILSRRGEILAAQGKLREAIAEFNQAIAVAPIDARPRTDLALAALQIDPNTRDESIKLLTQVVADSSWYTAAYLALADLAEKQGDLKQSEWWLQKGLTQNPNNADMLFALGKFYVRHKRADEARVMLTQVQKIETRIDIVPQIQNALAELGVQ